MSAEQEMLWDRDRGSARGIDWELQRQASKPWFTPVVKLWKHARKQHQHRVTTFGFLDWAAYVIPAVAWLRTYKIRELLPGDIAAGLSVGCMIIAQGLSYANLANLPSIYGLYGAFTPCMVYAFFGTSRQLAVGPVAVTSLLIGTSLKTLVPCSQAITNPNAPGPGLQDCQDLVNTKAIQLAFVVACIYTGVGVLRLGWITNLLSHAVISGFTSGAAITIGLSQIKYILGYSIPNIPSNVLHLTIQAYLDNVRNFKWQEFIMGITLMLMMLVMKELGKRYHRLSLLRTLGPIAAVVVGLLTVIIGHVDSQGIRTLGNIPKGLPPVTIGMWAPIDDPGSLLGLAIVVMLVDMLESTSIARALARKNNYELDMNKEIVGLGLANFAGALFSSYTTTGSFSRSAVNDLAGSKTPLCQFITAWVVGFVLLFLTPLFANLPYNVLGAVVVASVVSLFDFEQIIYLLRVSPLDALVWLASFLGTLFISVEIGLGIAIGLAVVLALYHIAFPHTALLGRVPGTGVFRNVKQYPDAQVTVGVVSFRIDAPIFFANCKNLQDKLGKIMERMAKLAQRHGLPGVKFLVLDLTPVTHVDAMGLHFLEELVFEGKAFGHTVVLANPSAQVLREFEPVHLSDLVGRENIFVSVNDATQFAASKLAEMGYAVTSAAVTKADAEIGSSVGQPAESATPAESGASFTTPLGLMAK